ncbi:HetP family heterocyst commitment protein [Anabaena lutea]|uniref:HetP family heterocyst commitment protein n=1 Tax=Anabaena lutea FACHB-196 TaxID=2692881 RepID=A0ABR8FG44_9NOST|nr:HetP family heterocyst commitment protein [Anabaena lutea]MBD2569029.1 HetP family heterocyst commitment protein [Anabaena lutea FACHB-196]
MIQQNFEQNQRLDKIFKHTHFQQIIKAIILGNYSWACVLFLHFSGYDPLEYIPHETYSNLLKENCILGEDNHRDTDEKKVKLSNIKLSWIKSSNSKHSSK